MKKTSIALATLLAATTIIPEDADARSRRRSSGISIRIPSINIPGVPRISVRPQRRSSSSRAIERYLRQIERQQRAQQRRNIQEDRAIERAIQRQLRQQKRRPGKVIVVPAPVAPSYGASTLASPSAALRSAFTVVDSATNAQKIKDVIQKNCTGTQPSAVRACMSASISIASGLSEAFKKYVVSSVTSGGVKYKPEDVIGRIDAVCNTPLAKAASATFGEGQIKAQVTQTIGAVNACIDGIEQTGKSVLKVDYMPSSITEVRTAISALDGGNSGRAGTLRLDPK